MAAKKAAKPTAAKPRARRTTPAPKPTHAAGAPTHPAPAPLAVTPPAPPTLAPPPPPAPEPEPPTFAPSYGSQPATGWIPTSAAPTPSAPPSAWQPVQPARKSETAKWAIPLIAGIGLFAFLPTIYYGVQHSWGGEEYLGPGTVLAYLLVGLALYASTGSPDGALSNVAGPHNDLGARLERFAFHGKSTRRNLLLGTVAVAALATVAVVAAIIFGPIGVGAVGSGLGILVGAMFFLAAYAVSRYRPLLPTAGALVLSGLLIEVQAVSDAWSVSHFWKAWALVLVVIWVPVQAMGAEAAFRPGPSRGWWALWTAIGTLLAVAWPVWKFFGSRGNGEIFLAMTLASLVWGIGADFSVAPVPRLMRWIGALVFAAWAGTIIAAWSSNADIYSRLQAAGLVAATACAAAALAFYVARVRAGANGAGEPMKPA